MKSVNLYLSAALVALALAACSDDGGGGTDLCKSMPPSIASLGEGVGSAFVPYDDLQEVGLAVAPQGGFGVTVLIRTEGLLAGEGLSADVQLNVEMDGAPAGEFLLEDAVFACPNKEVGGEIRGVVVGFDPDMYKTNDDLIALDGQEVDLVVTVTATDGETATVRKPLKIRVGG